MSGEPGTGDQIPKTIDTLSREFISSLPTEGISFHGTLNKNLPAIVKEGIKSEFKYTGSVDFYSFGPLGDSNPASRKEVQKLIQQFRGTLQKNVFWAAIHDSRFHEFKTDVTEEDLPAIVVMKRPQNAEALDINADDVDSTSAFTHEIVYPSDLLSPASIPASNILLTTSLTLDEYHALIKKYETLKGKPLTPIGEIARILQKKVLVGLQERKTLQTTV